MQNEAKKYSDGVLLCFENVAWLLRGFLDSSKDSLTQY